MSGSTDDERRIDGVGIHARLVVVMHGDKCPVSDDAGNAQAGLSRARDEILDGSGVEELDVGEGQDFGEKSRGEECLLNSS